MKDKRNNDETGTNEDHPIESRTARKRRLTEAELEALRYRGTLARKPDPSDDRVIPKSL